MRGGVEFPSAQPIRLLSTDLRDGAQTPGVNLREAERIEIAELLANAGIDVIEAGFPASSATNAAVVSRIARGIGSRLDAPVICGFARTGRLAEDGAFAAPDIDCAFDALQGARRPRVHIVGTGSDLHLREKYPLEGPEGRDRQTNISISRQSIARACALFSRGGLAPDVEFSPEDCGRADVDYLVDLLSAAVEAGATVLNIPDTVGSMLPDAYGSLIQELRARVVAGPHVIWSTHTHDDLGLATANALAGVKAGARQVEGTFIGLGERAGNACLEQIATVIRLHAMHYGCTPPRLDLRLLPTIATRIATLSKLEVPCTAPIVGRNAFRHKSGIHQDGILKKPTVYQDIPPAMVGRDIELELGPESGRAGLFYSTRRLGYEVPQTERARFFADFKALADDVGYVSDERLLTLIERSGLKQCKTLVSAT